MPTSGSGSASGVVTPAYPNEVDLQAFLEAEGFTLSAALIAQLDEAQAAANADFEKAIRRKLLAGASTTRYYDPPTNRHHVLFLEEGGGPGDLIGTITVAYQPTGSTLATLTLGTDYRLLPRNAVADVQPYDRIEFYNRQWADPGGVSVRGALQVTGQWGMGTTIPADAWWAMLAGGAMLVFGARVYAGTGAVGDWKENDVSESHNAGLWNLLKDSYVTGYNRAVANYRKIIVR